MLWDPTAYPSIQVHLMSPFCEIESIHILGRSVTELVLSSHHILPLDPDFHLSHDWWCAVWTPKLVSDPVKLPFPPLYLIIFCKQYFETMYIPNFSSCVPFIHWFIRICVQTWLPTLSTGCNLLLSLLIIICQLSIMWPVAVPSRWLLYPFVPVIFLSSFLVEEDFLIFFLFQP